MHLATRIAPALAQCTSDFERMNCLAIATAPPLPPFHWYTVTVRFPDGSAHVERMHRSSADSAASSMRAMARWKGWQYLAIETQAD